jgi:superfamily II DNA or RNA helicase
VWIEQQNLHCRVIRGTDAERSWLSEYLSFPDEKAKYVQRMYKGKRADGMVRMFNAIADTFPTGFLPLVRQAAQKEGFAVEVLDKRIVPCTPDASVDLSWLRDYQFASVDAILTRKRGILWLPTGSGKTEVSIGLAQVLPCRWLFTVHRATLLDQTANRYNARTGMQAGRVGDGEFDLGDGAFVVATFQTLVIGLKKRDPRIIALLKNAQGLIVDECHVLPAQTFWNTIMQTEAAYFRVGLSGTPLARGDRRSLFAIAAVGPIAHRVKSDVLVNAGVLARPTIKLVEVSQFSDRPTWQGVYGESIVRSSARNRTIVEMAKRATKPAFLFVKEIKHGRILEKMLCQAGIKCGFVWGNHSTEWRQAQVRMLQTGHIDVLICSVIFQEGVDVPALRSVVIGSGGKSVIAALQRVGRGMRVERDTAGNVLPGGDQFEVWDVADKGCGCARNGGPTHAGCRWLEKHAKGRAHAYAGEGYSTTTVAAVAAL